MPKAKIGSIHDLKAALQTMSVSLNGKKQVLSTGILAVNAATNVGGIPFGSIAEFFGTYQSGKSTTSAHMMGQALKQKIGVLYLDYERAFDEPYSARLGVSKSDPNFIYASPETLEEGGDMAIEAISSGFVKLVVMDTVAAAQTEAQRDADLSDATVATQARKMSAFMKKLSAVVDQQRAIFIGVNQEYAEIGTSGPPKFGYKPKTTPGGNALKFFSHIRIEFRLIGSLKKKFYTTTGDEYEAAWCSRTQVIVQKNKYAPPFRRENFYVMFGQGASNTCTLIDAGLYGGAIDKNGGIFKLRSQFFSEPMNFNGLIAIMEHFDNNPEAKKELAIACMRLVPELWPDKFPAGGEKKEEAPQELKPVANPDAINIDEILETDEEISTQDTAADEVTEPVEEVLS